MRVEEVATELDVSVSYAYKIIRLNAGQQPIYGACLR